MSDAVTIVVDDADDLLFGTDRDLFPSETLLFLNSTSDVVNDFTGAFGNTLSIVNTTTARYTVTFNGSSISLFGFTPISPPFNSTFQVASQFSGPFTRLSYPDQALGCQWYTSPPQVASNANQLIFSDLYGMAFDYALVTVGSGTDLRGKTILVDDTNPEIKWSGSWDDTINHNLKVGTTLPVDPPGSEEEKRSIHITSRSIGFTSTIIPHGNGTHDSATKGDSFTFRFAGSSVLVAGILPSIANRDVSRAAGVLTMNFTLDGNTTTRQFFSTDSQLNIFHFVYFQNDTLDPGNHTLTATVADIQGEGSVSAIIDYITYKPSFGLLVEKPVFNDDTPNSTTTSLPPPQNTSLVGKDNSDHNTPVGAIAGGVVAGVIILLALLIGGLFYYRRKRREAQRRRFRGSNIEGLGAHQTVEPFPPVFSPVTFTEITSQSPNTPSVVSPASSRERSNKWNRTEKGLQVLTVSSPTESGTVSTPTSGSNTRSGYPLYGQQVWSDSITDGQQSSGRRVTGSEVTRSDGEMAESRIRELVEREVNRYMTRTPPAYES
ncbi:hypothetical protein VKT23_011778 [Stygiomarasmius scandens]|uniref:Uncharacterized protein n=1 Tax=Marasmiellus scandens TaxID=2682957 RepID=A0ABR1JAK3_9AGAR